GRAAHLLEVVVLPRDPHALLRGAGFAVRPGLPSEENVLELVHSSVGEEEGRVVRGHEGGAGHHLVPAFLEEAEEGAAHLTSRPFSPAFDAHGLLLSGGRGPGGPVASDPGRNPGGGCDRDSTGRPVSALPELGARKLEGGGRGARPL